MKSSQKVTSVRSGDVVNLLDHLLVVFVLVFSAGCSPEGVAPKKTSVRESAPPSSVVNDPGIRSKRKVVNLALPNPVAPHAVSRRVAVTLIPNEKVLADIGISAEEFRSAYARDTKAIIKMAMADFDRHSRVDSPEWHEALHVKIHGKDYLVGELAKVHVEIVESWNSDEIKYGRVWQSDELKAYHQSIARDPENAKSYFARGNILFKRNEYEVAYEDFCKAIELDPQLACAYRERGRLHRLGIPKEENKLQLAMADFNRALQLDATDASSFSYRGHLRSALGDYHKAMDDHEASLRLAPEDATSYLNRAGVYFAVGEYERSRQDYEKAVSLRPDVGFYHFHIAQFFAACPDEKYRDGKLAIEHAKRSFSLDKWYSDQKVRKSTTEYRHNATQDVLAAAYAEAGEFNEAISLIKHLLEEYPGSPEWSKKLSLYRSHKPFRLPKGKIP